MSDISEDTHVDKAYAWDRNARKNEEISQLRRELRVASISVEAMAEIKASVDGGSEQPVKDIVYGALAEIAALKEADGG